ncbi:HNH endonuclease domain protein [Tolypothrix tenuis PCC 7101]|uniref:HNH endonuclease domain protein n=1 Tax=Tolypothrix tenuis PCC 7101 TaxID=231146 RepID=A0A1Z4N3B8_9CYAN|nr:HNH endonuclease [Aulosira sp. FACHB-113]BAZ00219.1 HNH endonuclease domain protein [Tolypothrix tenuis PCC 7101]BAZ75860.1 HNH endonuclease domain protein [Aulosira laxa NIES-50]
MVPQSIREIIADRAKYLCEYCHSPEFVNTDRFTVDHLIPQSLGGSDELENLALCCRRCNERRYNFTSGIDPQTQKEIPLFNPRTQQWSEHFIWSVEGTKIGGITPTGRATCNRLDMNDQRHGNGFIQKSRRLWVQVGWHPPQEDPRQENEN